MANGVGVMLGKAVFVISGSIGAFYLGYKLAPASVGPPAGVSSRLSDSPNSHLGPDQRVDTSNPSVHWRNGASAEAEEIKLPKMGTWDSAAFSDHPQLIRIRREAVNIVEKRAAKCAVAFQDGNTSVSLSIDTSIQNGLVSIAGISSVEAASGAPMQRELEKCLFSLVSQPIDIPAPSPPPNLPEQYKASFDGRWHNLPNGAGNFIAHLSFSDNCKRTD